MDLTVLYYTANRIAPAFQRAVAEHLVEALAPITDGPLGQGVGVITIAQHPLSLFEEFGPCLCVGDLGASAYNVYRQILVGALYADTTWVAMAEDDSLYTPEHFRFRPPDPDVFYYNRNRWVLTRRLSADGRSREGVFYWRERTQMAQCVCRRTLLIETLQERFAKYPDPLPDPVTFPMGWGEPGRYEKNLGLPPRRRAYFDTSLPNVTFNHAESIRGRRSMKASDRQVSVLLPWGNATELWNAVHG